ncbi:disulfide bond formation protein B [Nocardia sp. NPDC127579]|uniref:disulfide bond formation protein B n=1 Tax=Nocardia sp. NPDC127579 TaxID=3345402 RepID=UPI003641D6E9
MSAPAQRPLMTGDPRVTGGRIRPDEVIRPAVAPPAAPAVPDPPESGSRFGLICAHLFVLGSCGVLAVALFYQFVRGEYTCPMCLFQRMFVLLSAIGPGYVIARSHGGTVTARDWARGWGWTVLAAGCGAAVAATQVLMHIVPPDPGYAATLFGLHLYTWSLIAFLAAVFGAALLLFLTPAQTLDAAGTRATARITLGLLLAFALANLAACFLMEGLHWGVTISALPTV